MSNKTLPPWAYDNEQYVFFGAGGGLNKLRQKGKYASLIRELSDTYADVTFNKREFVHDKIVTKIEKAGGKFFVWDRRGKKWEEKKWAASKEDRIIIWKKISQALRDRKKEQKVRLVPPSCNHKEEKNMATVSSHDKSISQQSLTSVPKAGDHVALKDSNLPPAEDNLPQISEVKVPASASQEQQGASSVGVKGYNAFLAVKPPELKTSHTTDSTFSAIPFSAKDPCQQQLEWQHFNENEQCKKVLNALQDSEAKLSLIKTTLASGLIGNKDSTFWDSVQGELKNIDTGLLNLGRSLGLFTTDPLLCAGI